MLKPAEQTPLSILELAQDFEDAGLPPGVVNIVTGDGPRRRRRRSSTHPGVDKIAFTGSAEVGKIIMRSAADTLKRVSLELGGKSPNIFFADADFETAVDGALFGIFINQGEVARPAAGCWCSGTSTRKFVDAAAAKAKTIKLGPGWTGRPRWARWSAPSSATAWQVSGHRAEGGEGGGGRRQAQTVRQGLVSRADHLLRRGQLGHASRRKRSSVR